MSRVSCQEQRLRQGGRRRPQRGRSGGRDGPKAKELRKHAGGPTVPPLSVEGDVIPEGTVHQAGRVGKHHVGPEGSSTPQPMRPKREAAPRLAQDTTMHAPGRTSVPPQEKGMHLLSWGQLEVIISQEVRVKTTPQLRTIA